VKKHVSALFAAAALAVLAACGSSPTTPGTAAPTGVLADEAPQPGSGVGTQPPQDSSSQRVPNMMGSGN
jgi:uncharacterized lipoprotein